jgi:hypothetical protein
LVIVSLLLSLTLRSLLLVSVISLVLSSSSVSGLGVFRSLSVAIVVVSGVSVIDLIVVLEVSLSVLVLRS